VAGRGSDAVRAWGGGIGRWRIFVAASISGTALLGCVTLKAQPAAPPSQAGNAPFAVVEDCVAGDDARGQKEIHSYPPGILNTTYFIPAGAHVQFVLKDEFKPQAVYFGRVETDFDGGDDGSLFVNLKDRINATKIPDNHPLVKNGQADRSHTLITIDMPAEYKGSTIGGLWNTAKIYLYACEAKSPKTVSRRTMRVSSAWWSNVFTWGALLTVYLLAALTSQATDVRKIPWFKYFDPVLMTAGADGKGSLSKLQILFFSLIVFGLMSYIVLRTGVLSDMSTTVLTLLGITAVGSAAAKATDVQRNRITFENWAWLIDKKWLPAGGLACLNSARWRDLITSDGEFDVYRYQNCIFTLVVGVALLSAGINQLASFTIPDTLLGVLGISQAVYVAGKLISPPSIVDLNKSTDALRGIEEKFRAAASANPDPSPPAGVNPQDPPTDLVSAKRRAKPEYDAYVEAAKPVRIGFESLTGRKVSDSDVEPRFRL
jgi:hypothetical protein